MMTYNEIIKNINILLADDDPDYLMMTYAFLKQAGYNVDKVTDGNAAIEALKKNDYQILLLDYFMPGLNGEEVVKKVRETNKEIIIILQTGFAGKKPPIEMMQELEIQNYYDKTEGINRLNLELISAVKIFNQQNEIELSKYRTNAIGNLVEGIAQEIKADLLSVSAGLEVTNMLLKNTEKTTKQDIEKLNKFYENNKDTLSRIDKVLTSLIMQSSKTTDCIMESQEVMDIITLILKHVAKTNVVTLNTNVSVRPNSYIKGSVNDAIYIICEIMRELMTLKNNEKIDLTLTEDENNWYFNINSNSISLLSQSFIYMIKRICVSISDVSFNIDKDNNSISISILKQV